MAEKKCQDIVVSAVKKLLIAPLGAAKSSAVDVGFTNGNITITAAQEFADVMVDQSFTPVRSILTAANYNFAAPLAAMNLDNLAIALGVEFDAQGNASIVKERYYQVWIETEGPVNDSGVKAEREIYIPKLRLGGTAEIAFSRTDAQTANLEGVLVNCPDEATGNNINVFAITDTYESES